jgi:hypothetical protein
VSAIEQLRSYAKQLQDRFKLGAIARGTAIVGAVALGTTVLLALIIGLFSFSTASLWSARVVLLAALAASGVLGLALPLWHWSQRWWTRRAERAFPHFEQRLQTFVEKDKASNDPFLELLAVDTLRVAQTTDVKEAAPDTVLRACFAAGAIAIIALVWLIRAGPGALGYGAAAIWTGTPSAPLFTLHLSPGDATVRRHADQWVTAEIPGLPSQPIQLHVRYRSGRKWDRVAMSQRPSGTGFQFLFAGIPEDVEYYAQSGSIQTPHFHLRVADIPSIKQIRVTYHHPDWMKMADSVEEHGGDLRALAGTQAQVEVITDRPLVKGVLSLDDGRQLSLIDGRASFTIEKDGSYHVATRETVQEQRLSEDYFIQATAVKPPQVALVRPDRDYRASPIEEVTLAATADDPLGLNEFALHYSVNGGAEQVVNLKPAADAAATKLSGSTVLSLETLKLQAGDVVGFYAAAKDSRSEAKTDISFIQVDPYEREFSQSQQAGGGGGGGMGDDQAQIAEREKEIIAATWKQAGDKTSAVQKAAEQAKFLGDVQATLRNQALSLAGRLAMRDIQLANEQFGSFQQDMQAAAIAMQPAVKKLAAQEWNGAIFDEQKALQYLLRAEATFRQIQVAYGASGGSGAVNSAGRDLASLFDLELDTQKNQYESAQSPSSPNQQDSEVNAALKKLDELARRQSELAQQYSTDAQRSAEERWQQEMLRRKAEELQRQVEKMAGSPNAKQASERLGQAQESMSRGDSQSASQQLREASNLLGGIQQQNSSKKVDSLAREANRLVQQQREQAERMRQLASSQGQGGAGAPRRGVEGLINDRQRLADDLARLTHDMRAAQEASQERSRDTAKTLRDALGDLEEANTETQLQRSADQMRRGYMPLTDDAENKIGSELGHLVDQLARAGRASEEKSVDPMESLRGGVAALGRSYGGGRVDGGWNRGNNSQLPHAVAPDTSAPPPDTEAIIRQGLQDLEQLRQAAADDPAARHQIDELVRSMKDLDPKRFPGNPHMVQELYGRVLSDVDKLELQLRHEPAAGELAQVRSDSPQPIPAGYQSAVADYYRRLSEQSGPRPRPTAH